MKGKALLPLLGILSPLPAIYLYFAGNFYNVWEPYSLGMLVGLTAFTYFHVTLIISSRIKALDSIYGHDRVMQYHGIMGVAALVLGIMHRQLKVMVFPFTNFQILLGTIGLIILISVLSLTILFMVPNIIHRLKFLDRIRIFVNTNLGVDYSILKMIHNFTVLALIILSFHVILASSTLETWSRMIYMGALALLSLGLWTKHKIIRPLLNKRKGYTVDKVIPMGGNVTEVRIKPSSSHSLPDFTPGQFAFFRFSPFKGGKGEHPYTISSAPGDEFIGFTAKELGNFSRDLALLKEGTTAIVDGPYGVFTPGKEPNHNPLLFLAGGIGITPFLSVIKEGSILKDRRVTLLWGVRTQEDLHHNESLRSTQDKNPDFHYIPLLSHQEPEENQRGGFMTKELLQDYIQDPKETKVYLCGPPLMRRMVLKALKGLKVPRRNIHFEQFSL